MTGLVALVNYKERRRQRGMDKHQMEKEKEETANRKRKKKTTIFFSNSMNSKPKSNGTSRKNKMKQNFDHQKLN